MFFDLLRQQFGGPIHRLHLLRRAEQPDAVQMPKAFPVRHPTAPLPYRKQAAGPM